MSIQPVTEEAKMAEETQCILQNQIEIMGALSLLLRYAKPDLIGKAGELDRQRDDLLQRHKATQCVLTVPEYDHGGAA
jgi:hypothetical protein